MKENSAENNKKTNGKYYENYLYVWLYVWNYTHWKKENTEDIFFISNWLKMHIFCEHKKTISLFKQNFLTVFESNMLSAQWAHRNLITANNVDNNNNFTFIFYWTEFKLSTILAITCDQVTVCSFIYTSVCIHFSLQRIFWHKVYSTTCKIYQTYTNLI